MGRLKEDETGEEETRCGYGGLKIPQPCFSMFEPIVDRSTATATLRLFECLCSEDGESSAIRKCGPGS